MNIIYSEFIRVASERDQLTFEIYSSLNLQERAEELVKPSLSLASEVQHLYNKLLALKKAAALSGVSVDNEGLAVRIFVLGQEQMSTSRVLQELITTQ